MPKFLDVEQGSEEWLELRKKCVTATDIATIMGVNPYKTAYQLWQEKLGLKELEIENDAMRRGKELEPIALEACCKIIGKNFYPAVVTHDRYPWAMASLDGISQDRTSICEIKCMGKANHEEALGGHVKELYNCQMQWQMFVTELYGCSYFAFSKESNHLMTIFRDQDLINKMIPAAEKFLKCLDTFIPPEMTDRDYVDRSDDDYLSHLMVAYNTACKNFTDCEKIKDEFKQMIVEHCENKNTLCSNGKVTRVSTTGKIKYQDIPELKNVDLEKYRGENTISYRITIN